MLKKAYPLKYEDYIISCSEKYNLDKYLIMGIISAESKFNENAVSHKDAKGLMQIKDETALWCIENFEISTDCEPQELNIRIGCAYMRYLLDKYHGNEKTALAAYNAGEGNVNEWLKNQSTDSNSALESIPYKETADYVKRVDKRAKIYRFLY
ncbi:MAG: lytic transglycosylase domain-containing protein [Clostridia bacterium]|nr:lytic transglycosylase domain-containing protein [Clostridia bacterium]